MGTSLARTLRPCFLSRRLLSMIMYPPNTSVKTRPSAPKAAVVDRAGIYCGASWSRKMFDETTPITLAIGTPRLVKRSRLFSSAMLLLYQVSSSTDGAERI